MKITRSSIYFDQKPWSQFFIENERSMFELYFWIEKLHRKVNISLILLNKLLQRMYTTTDCEAVSNLELAIYQ